jgi:outer membrane protein TolC
MMVERILQANLNAAKQHLKTIELQIKKGENNSRPSLMVDLELSVARQVLAKAESELDLWRNKKIKKVKQDQVEALFEEN